MKSGLFLAFEGADGVGKSTVMRIAIPLLVQQGGFSGYTFFHWKPIPGGVHSDSIPEGDSQNPRGKSPRNPLASLLYLFFHWLTFWRGFLVFLRPALKANRLVIADRYIYDVLLDPTRFRLRLPRWALRIFVSTLPQPASIIALHASPETIRRRKPELTPAEIEHYQRALLSLSPKRLIPILAEAKPQAVAEAILAHLVLEPESSK